MSPTPSASQTPSVSPTLSLGASPSQTVTGTPTQTPSTVFAVVQVRVLLNAYMPVTVYMKDSSDPSLLDLHQIGVGVTLGGGLSAEVVTTPSVGVLLRSGLACIANVSLASVTIASTTVVNNSVRDDVVPVSASDAVNTATSAAAPCDASSSTARLLLRHASAGVAGLRARALAAAGASSSLDVGLSISVSTPAVGSPQSSAPVASILAALAPMLNASATNFSSGAGAGGGGGSASSGGGVATAFSSFASAAATASGSDPAAFSLGVSAQTVVVTVPSSSPSQSPSSSSAPRAPPAAAAMAVTASLSPGAIAGIVVGGAVFVALVVVVAVFMLFRRKKIEVLPARKGVVTAPVPDVGQPAHAIGNYGNLMPQARVPPLQRGNSYTTDAVTTVPVQRE